MRLKENGGPLSKNKNDETKMKNNINSMGQTEYFICNCT